MRSDRTLQRVGRHRALRHQIRVQRAYQSLASLMQRQHELRSTALFNVSAKSGVTGGRHHESLYIASTGMAARSATSEVISNNIANMRTTGCKRSVWKFR